VLSVSIPLQISEYKSVAILTQKLLFKQNIGIVQIFPYRPLKRPLLSINHSLFNFVIDKVSFFDFGSVIRYLATKCIFTFKEAYSRPRLNLPRRNMSGFRQLLLQVHIFRDRWHLWQQYSKMTMKKTPAN
jgi:hypothetical protein